MPLRRALPLLASLVVSACALQPAPKAYVVAVLQPTRGNTTAGTIWLVQDGPDVLVRGKVSGLKPNQLHGFHVHEKGDCSSNDGMSTGGHFNPFGKPHGHPGPEHHAGDLPALQADARGDAEVRFQVPGTVLGSGPGALAGKGLIVHAGPDDYTTQPTGNSGARIACGTISAQAGHDAAGNEVPLPRDL